MGLCPSKMQSVLVDREVWSLILSCYSCNHQGKAGEEKKKKYKQDMKLIYAHCKAVLKASVAIKSRLKNKTRIGIINYSFEVKISAEIMR